MTNEEELSHLSQVIGLAAFAAEAQRVLSEVDCLAAAMPQIDALLSPIAVRHEWIEMPNTLAGVLRSVHYRLDELCWMARMGRCDDHEVAAHRS